MKKLLSILILFFIIMGCSKTVQPYVTVPFEQGLWGGNLVSTTSNNGVQKVNATGSLGFIFTSRNYQYSGSYYLFATNTTQNDFRWNGQFKKLCDSMVTLVDARDTILTAYAIPTLNLHGNYKYKWDGQMLTIFRTDSLTTVKITLHRLFPE